MAVISYKGIPKPEGWSMASWEDYIRFDPDHIFGDSEDNKQRLAWVLKRLKEDLHSS